MKFAVKIAYLGAHFEGSQKQPGKRTVQGELEKLLGPVKCASRTDTGVSALGAVFTFEAEAEPHLYRLNQLLPEDIISIDIVPVSAGFNPRHALSKHYKYYLPWQGSIISLKKKTFSLPMKTALERVSISKEGPFAVFDVYGAHFGYRAVRKIIGDIIERGAVPPWGLVLVDIQYADVKFSDRVKSVFKKKFEKEKSLHLQLSRVLEDLRTP